MSENKREGGEHTTIGDKPADEWLPRSVPRKDVCPAKTYPVKTYPVKTKTYGNSGNAFTFPCRIIFTCVAACAFLFLFKTEPLPSAAAEEPLDLIRQRFEIYSRHSGEIELLHSGDPQKIDGVLKRTETKRLEIRKALENGTGKSTAPALFLEPEAAAPFLHYAAAENAAALRAIQHGKPDDAAAAVSFIYRCTDELLRSASPVNRIAAARIRIRTFDTVQTFCLSPCCRQKDHEMLYCLFAEQLAVRPNDQTLWTHYRQEGEKFYETILRSGWEQILPEDVQQKLIKRNAFAAYKKQRTALLKQDRESFRRLMHAVIEACALPYDQRQKVMQVLTAELRNRQGTSSEHVFAGLLLQEIPDSMRQFAQERTANEMMYLALSVSVKGAGQPQAKNFLTGSEYKVQPIPDGIMTTYEGNIKPFYLPYRR